MMQLCHLLLLLTIVIAPVSGHTKLRSRNLKSKKSSIDTKGIISDDEVRRTVVRAETESTLKIPHDVATPDRTEFGGITGITYDDDRKVYYAITKDVSPTGPLILTKPPFPDMTGTLPPASVTFAPGVPPALQTIPPLFQQPRFFTLTFDQFGQAQIQSVTYLRDSTNRLFGSGYVKPQAITYAKNKLYVALDRGDNAPKELDPLIIQYNVTGFSQGNFTYPDYFRFNDGFTALTVNPQEDTLYAATGNGLRDDAGDWIRITEFDLVTRASGRQYVYQAEQKVVGMVSLDDNGGFAVVERSEVIPEYEPNITYPVWTWPPGGTLPPGAVSSAPISVTRAQEAKWQGYNVTLYYALCLDALDVQTVNDLVNIRELPLMRRDKTKLFANVSRIEAVGPGSRQSFSTPFYKSTFPLKTVGDDGEPASAFPLQLCEADCDDDHDCADGLECMQRKNDDDPVSEYCTGTPDGDKDYCVPKENSGKYKGDIQLILMSDNDLQENRPTQALFVGLEVEETPVLNPELETTDLLDDGATGRFAMDPAIWVHPTIPDYSLILGALARGEVGVYDMNGVLRQNVGNVGLATGIDVMYAFKLDNDDLQDIAVVSDTSGGRILVFSIQHDHGGNFLQSITDGSMPPINSPRGVATYHSPYTGKQYVFVISGNNQIRQVELNPTGDGDRVTGSIIRTLDAPSYIGGIVVDTELGFVYVTLENNRQKAIIKYDAEPNELDSDRVYPATVVSGDEEYFKEADIEGITLYYGDKGEGYLVASVSGDSTFAVFEREKENEYYDSFTIGRSKDKGIDRTDNSEGITITNVNLGPSFKCGLFVAQDYDNDVTKVDGIWDGKLVNSNTNFKLVSFEELAEKLAYSLDVDTDSWDPRRFALVVWINCIAQDVYSELFANRLSGRDTEELLDHLNEASTQLFPRGSKKQQMISLIDPFDRRRRLDLSIEERREETRRRLREIDSLSEGQRRELKKSGCRRRLGVDLDDARDALEDFRSYLDKLNSAGRVNGDKYKDWRSLANEIKSSIPEEYDDR